MKTAKSINIAVLAMGGEGGGVLADWLVRVGESGGYLAQTTSVPGVSQRTGATIYYLELFPKSALPRDGRMPVLGLMPMPGDVDLVVASELMEAGRAVQRGLVTPDRTHLVASTHRVYSMTERTAVGDGRVDAEAIVEACKTAARKLTSFDMAALAEANRSVISAALLGAIAGSQALPFAREAYEAAIRSDGVGVEASLAAFSAAFAAAERSVVTGMAADRGPDPVRGEPDPVLPTSLRGEARMLATVGARRAADYQDEAYAREYVERLTPFVALAESKGDAGQQFLAEIARQLALGMTYDDPVRVAELKIRDARFERVHTEIGARPGQVIEIADLPPELRAQAPRETEADWKVALGAEADRMLAGRPGAVWDGLVREFERTLIRHALIASAGRRIEAAQMLGIGRNTITRKIQELGMENGGADSDPPEEVSR